MTSVIIDDTVPYTQVIATSGQTQFDTDWTADDETDVVVYARATGVAPNDVTQLVSPNDYTISYVGIEEYIRVTFLVGRTLNDVVTITRATPIDRENLYTNTNFTPSMLNQDFGLFTLQMQERDLYETQLTPRYNTSATIEPIVDTILPVLGARQVWRKNAGDTEIEAYDLPDGDIAPADQTYITLTDESASLPNSFAVDSLAAGILINKPNTNELLSRVVDGTTNQINVADGDGIAGDIVLSIADNPVMPGTAGMGIPSGTTAQRVVPTPPSIGLRYNTDLGQMEFYAGGTWNQVEDSTDIATLLALLASHTAGQGASLIGLQTPSTSTVQDLSEAEFYVLNPNDALPNAIQFDPADYLPLAGGTMAGDIDMGSNGIINLVEPINPQDAATKFYVDQTALHGTSVRAATTATLNATQAGAGVGATLTDASGTFAAFSVDGQSPSVGDLILNKDQANAAHQGIYQLTQNGNGVNLPWILTRATSYDTPTEINNTGLIAVRTGTTNAGRAFYNTATIVTVDTTNFSYSPFGTSGTVTSVTAGTGLTATTNPITTSGTISFAAIAARRLWANTTGSSAVPTETPTSTFLQQVDSQVITTTGASTYTPTSGMVYCIVEAVGGGGSGGGASASGAGNGSAAGGGAGGGYCWKLFTAAEIGASAAVTVGTGGAAPSAGANPGNAGGTTTFNPDGTGATLTATGGSAGTAGTSSASINVSTISGAGGTGTNGDYNISGQRGSAGWCLASGTLAQGGAGGNSMLGMGGVANALTSSSGGVGGTGYGAGGDGAIALGAAGDRAGAAGTQGVCIVTEFIAL